MFTLAEHILSYECGDGSGIVLFDPHNGETFAVRSNLSTLCTISDDRELSDLQTHLSRKGFLSVLVNE